MYFFRPGTNHIKRSLMVGSLLHFHSCGPPDIVLNNSNKGLLRSWLWTFTQIMRYNCSYLRENYVSYTHTHYGSGNSHPQLQTAKFNIMTRTTASTTPLNNWPTIQNAERMPPTRYHYIIQLSQLHNQWKGGDGIPPSFAPNTGV